MDELKRDDIAQLLGKLYVHEVPAELEENIMNSVMATQGKIADTRTIATALVYWVLAGSYLLIAYFSSEFSSAFSWLPDLQLALLLSLGIYTIYNFGDLIRPWLSAFSYSKQNVGLL